MRIFQFHARAFALSTILVAAPFAAAHAQMADAAVERLKALVVDQGAEIEWESVDVSGSDAVLVGVTIGNAEEMVPIGNVTLSGISEIDEGYRVETVTMDRFERNEEDTKFSMDGVAMTGVILPNEDAQDGYGGFLFYETADVGEVIVDVKGTQVFTLNNMSVDVTMPGSGSPMGYTGGAEVFTIDLSGIEDPQQKAIIQALGYEKLSGNLELAGTWDPEDGRMTLSQNDFTIDDAGTLGFSVDLGGYTTEFVKSLRELQKQMAANPDEDSSQQGLAMLGLMQQLTFNGAEIDFSDNSLTNKVLEFVAEGQGVKPSDIANQAKAVLPFVLAQLNNPELTAAATEAVSAFLDDPQNLRITAAPAQPVPFALIAAGAMSTPQELPKTLGVKVTANE